MHEANDDNLSLINREGFTVIEAIISIVILSMTIIIVMNFKNSLLENELFVNKYITVQTEIDSNLSDIYNEWNTEDYSVNTKVGTIKVSIEELDVNEHGNDMLEVNFEVEELVKGYDVDKKYVIERSTHYHE